MVLHWPQRLQTFIYIQSDFSLIINASPVYIRKSTHTNTDSTQQWCQWYFHNTARVDFKKRRTFSQPKDLEITNYSVNFQMFPTRSSYKINLAVTSLEWQHCYSANMYVWPCSNTHKSRAHRRPLLHVISHNTNNNNESKVSSSRHVRYF